MSTRIPALTPAQLDPEQSALYFRIAGGPRAQGPQHFALTTTTGALRGPFNAFLLAPQLGNAVQALGAALRYDGSLSDRAREIVILLVASQWTSAFEQNAHEAVGRAAGLSDAELAALRERDVEGFTEPERTIARLALSMLAGDVDDDLWDKGERAVGAAGVFEVSTLVGYYAMLALQLRAFRVE